MLYFLQKKRKGSRSIRITIIKRGIEGKRRSGDSAYLLLLTLEEGEDKFDPEKKQGLMEELYEIIRNALRKGDAFTQYSSCLLYTSLYDLMKKKPFKTVKVGMYTRIYIDSFEDWYNSQSVSYTHLDVYKRQRMDRLKEKVEKIFE